jgi:hypothetical protein
VVKADGNYTLYTSNPDALVNWDFIEQIVRKETHFNYMCGNPFGVCSVCINPFEYFVLAFAEF